MKLLNNNKRFLITGGNFTNKGAQSMLFVAVDEIKKRFVDAEIIVLPLDDYRIYKENLQFRAIRNHPDVFKLDGKKFTLIKLLCKNILRFILFRKNWIFSELFYYPKIMRSIDLIVDISGFCLSSQFVNSYNMSLVRTINEAKKYNVPIVLMPQSFGPFDYKNEKEEMLNAIRSVIDYPYAIFARELDGFDQLIKTFGVQNVRQSVDLVLQNKGVDLKNIYKSIPDIRYVKAMPNSVALIPNSMNVEQSNHSKTVLYYKTIIEFLRLQGKHVYIVSHSGMDMQLCKEIYEMLEETSSIELIKEELMSYEFDVFVKQMDFVVASRYHSIVHAYKNFIPCVILGWSVKYVYLSKVVGQDNKSFDIRNSSIDSICSAIKHMCSDFNKESELIKNHVNSLQDTNCFDVLNEIIGDSFEE